MKKIYQQPVINILKVQVQSQLMAGSLSYETDTTQQATTETSQGGWGAREGRGGFFDDEDGNY